MTQSLALPTTPDGVIPIAVRVKPQQRRVHVPDGVLALLVRDNQPERSLDAGEHTVRTFFQSTPELYLSGDQPHFLPLWVTNLTTADGRGVALGWRIQVQVHSQQRLWEAWLRHLQAASIPSPAEEISARLADHAQTLVQRYNVADLRDDNAVRRDVAGQLSRKLAPELEAYGLEFGAMFDPLALRWLTQEDLARAAEEKAQLERILADEQLKTVLNKIDNVDTLAYRLMEVAANHGATLDFATALDLAQQALGQTVLPPVTALMQAAARPLPAPTPTPVDLPQALPHANHHLFRRLGLLVIIASTVVALTLATIYFLRPELMLTAEQRDRLVMGVIGIAMLGVLIAWVIDQVIRWEAEQSAERMQIAADLEPVEESNSRMEARHVLMLLGAFVAIGVAAASFWLPEYVNWLRVVAAGVGLLGAAFAIRIDWLHNVNRANAVLANAERRVAGAKLDAAQRQRFHLRQQAQIGVELEVLRQRLDQCAIAAYRSLNDRRLNSRLRALEPRVQRQLEAAQRLDAAKAGQPPEEWAQTRSHLEGLAAQAAQASATAVRLQAQIEDRDVSTIESEMRSLESAISTLDDQFKRYAATVV